MCGISGILAFTESGRTCFPHLSKAIQKLQQRGPDAQRISTLKLCALGHTRLSVIDTSSGANQPFFDHTGRYALVFNGEIYNYKHLKERHLQEYELKSHSDTEVLLYMFIKYGTACLELLHGFFACCFVDTVLNKAVIARDRYGKKPLVYYQDADKFIFASEIKALESFDLPLSLNTETIFTYFKYTYNPSNNFTIYKEVYKLPPGHLCEISLDTKEVHTKAWFTLVNPSALPPLEMDYESAQHKLRMLLDVAVRERLVSDVPLGAFLSGGIDSSIIVAIGSNYISKLKTFSIGFKDQPFFDETHYADLVAKKFNTEHHKIMISNQTLLDCVLEVLDYIDEPFADASALALYVLSKETKKHVTVALSGDGADEIFGGYNKYAGLQTIQQLPSICRSKSVLIFDGLLKGVPTSRTGPFSNGIRQLRKLLQGMALEPHERYLKFSAINTSKEVSEMFNEKFMLNFDYDSVKELEYSWSVKDEPIHDINDILWRDQSMVLPNDMLVKVDLMAMANSLEVRCPFLDHTIGSFVNRLPARYKLDGKRKKKMLQDAYRKDLPEALYNRPKKGFDVPLIPWFQKELHSFVFNELLERSFVERQGIFDYSMITRLKDKLFAQNKGEVQAQLWSLVVFQYWYKKRFT